MYVEGHVRHSRQEVGGGGSSADRWVGPSAGANRGRPSYVLLTFDAYERLLGAHVVDRLGEPAGVEDIDLVVAGPNEHPKPAVFD